jgi:hypothetical protein
MIGVSGIEEAFGFLGAYHFKARICSHFHKETGHVPSDGFAAGFLSWSEHFHAIENKFETIGKH